MPQFNDRSGNGSGVNLNQHGSGDAIVLGGSDFTVKNAARIRAGSAANLVLRYPNSSADITIATGAGEYIPVSPGTIIRSTTTVTPIHAITDQG